MPSMIRNLRAAIYLVVALLVACLVPSAKGQTFRGTILGTVTDSSGAAVSGAKVTVRNADTGLERSTQTSDDGSYAVPELPIGTYTVTVEKEGFQKSITTGIKVDVATESRVDAGLKPGELSQSVTVSGETLPQINTTSDTLGGTLTADVVKNLPVNGRDYTKLIYLNPGVTGSPDQITDSPGSFGVFSVNGARGRANNFLLDGTDMNDGFRNDPAINEAGVFGTPATILPIDAVEELHVLSNYEPEYGRNAGAVINIVTKSGTNSLHGTAVEYFRNNALDARNFFNFKGTPQAPFHNNQYGGSLGGPIIRDKTFFFLDYEGQEERVGSVSQACVPVGSAADGSLSSNDASNEVIKALIARHPWPAPNIPSAVSSGSCPNASVVAPSLNKLSSLIGKADHSISPNDLLSGRYYFGDSVQSFPLALTGGGILPGFNTTTPTRVQLVSISYSHVFSANQLNEARMGWNRFAEGFFPQDQSFQPSSIGLNVGSGLANSGLPVINVNSFSQIGASHSDPRHRVDTNWQFFDNYSWKVGRHDIKMGYEYRRTSISQILGTNFRGILKFATLSDFLAGNVTSGSQASGDSNRNTFENSHGLYIQDGFRVTSRLTINAGVRWDYFGVMHEKQNLFSNFIVTAPGAGTLIQQGTPGLSQLYQPDYKNFGPRLSLAYDPFGHGKTVIRAGWGIFYDAFSQDFFLGHLPFNCSFCPGPAYNPIGPAPISSVSAVGGTINKGIAVFATPGATPSGNIFAVDPNVKTPYMENFNLNIQQQLFSKVVLQVGYVGSEGHRLFRFLDLNQPGTPAISAFDKACGVASFASDGGVPGPFDVQGCGSFRGNNPVGASYINQEQTSANSNYHSLQTSLRVNGWHGLSTQANFVWSHSIDNASDGEDFVANATQPNDSTHPNLERGNSNFDVRRRFTWNYVYMLPNQNGSWSKLTDGWGLDGVLSLQDGQPFQLNYNFESGDDYDGSGELFGRPDVTGPAQYNPGNAAAFLNLTTFTAPCTLVSGNADVNCVPGSRHFGNEGRNSLRGPSFKQFDFSLFKDTKLTERLTMQLRAEFFNFFNHPNFANPYLPLFIADAAPNGFGAKGQSLGSLALTTTGDVGIGNPFLGGGGPRGIQLAAKFSF
ncbi:MAG: TonB-dependent receptor domain-containing protein [Candidatus Acidiferrales bacterium]